ncbi:LuxR C-terminal-related transcriptional regulator [Micromonospora sp. WMMD1120]|uniref:LuxR C-terminal-related transcriptional regulator n=1 Tax=Micromonospora sp. WMMD1120 TaxID=3016106 RepID=UPI0024165979|nr:LuxR C-terminal-related transcriptional regulator [Micromonospora sp. WMMD1120]MDG4809468.1 LuxR C-terminal-related transcriptional regulator [Micromonospora sp. WMMD1120]
MSRRHPVVGRQAELGALAAAGRDTSGSGRLALVRGVAGSGRTALLRAAADAWRDEGAVVLWLPPAEPGESSEGGFEALLHTVRQHYELLGEPSLAVPVADLGALCASPADRSTGRTAALAREAATLFHRIGSHGRAVLITDDAGGAPGRALALDAATRPGVLVVAATEPDAPAAGRLDAMAEVVIELPALATPAVRDLLDRRHGTPVDNALVTTLAQALGPLAGHPATVVATVEALRQDDRLTVAGGHLCLRDPHEPIPLPPGHPLTARLYGYGTPAVRLATMASVARFGLADLPLFAAATLGDPDGYGAILDELVSAGVLVADRLGDIRPQSPALAARLVRDAGPRAVARLHRACAAALLRRAGAGEAGDRLRLADHVTSAGTAMPPDRRTAVTLLSTAVRAAEREPGRAAHWLTAALRHCDDGDTAGDIQARLLRLLVRTGQFSRLAAEVDRIVARGVPAADRADLAAAALLAALHTGDPLPQRVRAAFAGPDATVAFGDAWPAAAAAATAEPAVAPAPTAALLAAHEVAVVRRALTGGPAADPLLRAGGLGDVVEVLRLVLGDARYGPPVDGAAAAYHRLHEHRCRGDLAGVLSAAREANLTGAPDQVVPRLARLWAAEVLALSGQTEAAAEWVRSVPAEPPYAALRWWVTNGPGGEPRDATDAVGRIAAGWRAYDAQRAYGSPIGVEYLLVRIADLAARFGVDPAADRLRALRADDGPLFTSEAAALIRALTDGDPTAAAQGAGQARTRGHRLDLWYATLALGRTAEDAGPWLLEAHAVARTLGAPVARSVVAGALRQRGMAPPQARGARPAFSAVEVQIIELLRGGRTNRQIAARLRLSEKTIENHLTRLFARTGLRSRVELAAATVQTDVLGAAS